MFTAERLVDGVAPGGIVSPGSDEDVVEILQSADGDDWILPVGGGTALTAGNAVERIPTCMDLTELSGITDYEPADLTVSVRAGTRWAVLMSTLAENGQTVPLDVPFPQLATVGGVVATGWAGPRRLRDGTLKDLLIGASFVRGDALLAKAGGMVVKNVSGFEIPRLLHGSYGSLAVITSVNLKVIPIHESELTLQWSGVPFYKAVQNVLTLTRAEPAIAAAVVDGDGSEGTVAIRLSGRANPIRELAERNQATSGQAGTLDQLAEGESADFWQQRLDRLAAADENGVVIEVGSPPACIPDVVERLSQELSSVQTLRYAVSPGTGSVILRFASSDLSWRRWIDMWKRIDDGGKVRFVVIHAPRTWRLGAQIWAIPEGQRTIMDALKRQFDPEHRLNRGRLWDVTAGESPVPIRSNG